MVDTWSEIRASVASAPNRRGGRQPAFIDSGVMDLEEKTIEKPGDRCEECGAKLTPAELQAAMESGGPALCSVHADEVVPVSEDEADFGED